MSKTSDSSDMRITRLALEELERWTRAFRGKLRRQAVELSGQRESSVVTVELVKEALLTACQELAAESANISDEEGEGDGRGAIAA